MDFPLLLTPPSTAAARSSCKHVPCSAGWSPHLPCPDATACAQAGHRARASLAREDARSAGRQVLLERRACADALAACRQPSARSATPGMGLHCTGVVSGSQASHSWSPAECPRLSSIAWLARRCQHGRARTQAPLRWSRMLRVHTGTLDYVPPNLVHSCPTFSPQTDAPRPISLKGARCAPVAVLKCGTDASCQTRNGSRLRCRW